MSAAWEVQRRSAIKLASATAFEAAWPARDSPSESYMSGCTMMTSAAAANELLELARTFMRGAFPVSSWCSIMAGTYVVCTMMMMAAVA